MSRVDMQALMARIDTLPPTQMLLLAGQLMAAGQHDLAITLAERVVMEYQAAKVLVR